MINPTKKLIAGAILVCSYSCQFQLYTKKDITREKADLTIDEAPHAKNSLEWWYFTGHVADSSQQKEFGVEYVFFHFNPTRLKSYLMVNLAVTDPESEAFYYDYKMIPFKPKSNNKLPLNLKLDKQVFAHLSGQAGSYKLKAKMNEHHVRINLSTKPAKQVVLHDGIGYEDYGGMAKAGYYSYPRLKTEGNIMIKHQEYLVKGEMWYDRQWNCSGVTNKNMAWDWFSIQFKETNSELMVYRLYDLSTEQEIFGGTYTDSLGQSTYLKEQDIHLQEIAYWKSTASFRKYPVKWNLEVPSLKIKTEVEALIPNQELNLRILPINFYYWEGMCQAKGSIAGKQVTGNSYVEMTNRIREK